MWAFKGCLVSHRRRGGGLPSPHLLINLLSSIINQVIPLFFCFRFPHHLLEPAPPPLHKKKQARWPVAGGWIKGYRLCAQIKCKHPFKGFNCGTPFKRVCWEYSILPHSLLFEHSNTSARRMVSTPKCLVAHLTHHLHSALLEWAAGVGPNYLIVRRFNLGWGWHTSQWEFWPLRSSTLISWYHSYPTCFG